MIKKFKVTNTYAVSLFCDNCGKELNIDNIDSTLLSNPPVYVYQCECGQRQHSRKRYPLRMFEYDLDSYEIIEE